MATKKIVLGGKPKRTRRPKGVYSTTVTTTETTIDLDPDKIGEHVMKTVREALQADFDKITKPASPATLASRRRKGLSSKVFAVATGRLRDGLQVKDLGNDVWAVVPSNDRRMVMKPEFKRELAKHVGVRIYQRAKVKKAESEAFARAHKRRKITYKF